jgi:hypothetical protein
MNPTWQTDDGRVKLWLALLLERPHIRHVARFAAIVSILGYSLRKIVSLRPAVGTCKDFAESVKLGVLRAGRQLKILYSIVRFVAVDVVNQIIGRERASDVLLHNDAMFTPAVIDAVTLGRKDNVAFAVNRSSSAKMASPGLRGCFALKAPATKNSRLQHRPARDGLLLSALATAKPFVVFSRPRVIRQYCQATKDFARQVGNFVHAAI